MLFKKKRPRTQDLAYVKDVFSLLVNANLGINHCSSALDQFPDLSNYEKLKSFIRKILFEIGINVQVKKVDSELEYVLSDLPRTYYYDEIDGQIILTITTFGIENPDVTVCEVILFLMGIKIDRIGISLDKEVYEDLENAYRPLMVVVAIFYGYGIFLLSRNWISGGFYDKLEELNMRYCYYIPLDLDTMIYSHSLVTYFQKQKFKTPYPKYNFLEKTIIREIEACYRFLEKGNAPYIGE